MMSTFFPVAEMKRSLSYAPPELQKIESKSKGKSEASLYSPLSKGHTVVYQDTVS